MSSNQKNKKQIVYEKQMKEISCILLRKRKRKREREEKSSLKPHHRPASNMCPSLIRSWCATPNTPVKGSV